MGKKKINVPISVKISKDSLFATDMQGNERKIKFTTPTGDDITPLAEIAVKSGWFTVDNPQYTPDSWQYGQVLSDNRIDIINIRIDENVEPKSWPTIDEILKK